MGSGLHPHPQTQSTELGTLAAGSVCCRVGGGGLVRPGCGQPLLTTQTKCPSWGHKGRAAGTSWRWALSPGSLVTVHLAEGAGFRMGT